MTKCPRCFYGLPSDTFCFTAVTPQSTSIDDIASAFTGHPVAHGKIVTMSAGAPAEVGAIADRAAAEVGGPVVELCPICHYRLPPDWRLGDATCLAMAGARATGKTVFIAVMIKQFERFAEQYGCEVVAANHETTRRYREEYEQPLFEERGILAATRPASIDTSYQHDPLIFHLGLWNGLRRYLVIRDVAGEDLEDPTVGGTQWQFFAVADAVIFMFDPLRLHEISDQLRDLVPTGHSIGGDPREVLRTVMRLIGNGDPKLAVVLSKFDALQELRAVNGSAWGRIMSNAGAAFARDPGLLGGRYDQQDGYLLDAEVRSLLQRLDAGPMLQHMQNPLTGRRYNHQFFAVSALGASPSGSKLHPSGISPFRCLDPVHWVLTGRNIL